MADKKGIRRILIANRGEIAVRVIRTCQRLGIETVLCVSEADRDSLGARMATRAVCIGASSPALSYLNIPAVVQAAIGYGCDAIHPGYGFLSEQAELAQLCEQEGVIFIGPTAAQIEAVGDKLRARTEAIAADVPVVPGGAVDLAVDGGVEGGDCPSTGSGRAEVGSAPRSHPRGSWPKRSARRC